MNSTATIVPHAAQLSLHNPRSHCPPLLPYEKALTHLVILEQAEHGELARSCVEHGLTLLLTANVTVSVLTTDTSAAFFRPSPSE